MTAHICRKARALLSSPGGEANVAAPSQLGMELFVSEHAGSVDLRQHIIRLYDDLRPPLLAYLCCLGMNADQAEDVIQETFLRLVRYRFGRGAQDNLRAWVFRVAHNLSMDVHRFQRRWSLSEDDEPHRAIRRRADPAPSPEQQVLLDERMKRFEDAFGQLTPKQRQCVLLRAEGLRYREIALVLGISVQRVGELMQRSISLLEVHI
jgi:RNA polymerase sigma-70 factor, ECF subfamily